MQTTRRIYISGPMTGLPELNFPAFFEAARELRAVGYVVINPAEVNPDLMARREDCLRADIRALTHCDGLALLDGWERSAGARREVDDALAMGFIVAPLRCWFDAVEAAHLTVARTWKITTESVQIGQPLMPLETAASVFAEVRQLIWARRA